MALDFAKVRGGPYTITFGGVDVGAKGIVDVTPWFDIEEVLPEDYGGEPFTYLLVKKPVIVSMVLHQFDATQMNLFAGPWAAGEIDDDYMPGYNVGADAAWAKALVLIPTDGAAGKLKFTFPCAIAKPAETIKLSSKQLVLPVQFLCIRGTNTYHVKWEQI